ncbi:histidine phosphatase family protein [Nocardia seriolae]|nr:histidine phosphatase family protein [Nocardia seriolae]MTJ67034.1 histidine phosphatase family protein [Nocardia seriolae]MTJ71650.1 histidine phosphatase family protein [Nocardia seriolae]MTK46932.1 histidine phosphatase family protein [Nocardia seriolae]OJF84789.1 histidine phosphatase family protein [Nocardia seriolae]PSK30859.1 histidine phosphatase family protein [Nocardia seriolae]
MSSVTRLTLITHAITDAVLAARVPADEPLNPLGERSVARAGGLPRPAPTVVLHAPELRTEQTAKALGLDATAEPALRDLDCGAWSGKSMDDITPGELMDWLTNPAHRSHGGESITDLLARVGTWLDTLAGSGDRIIAVTHPGVVRAAILHSLNAPAESFWRIDIPPLTVTTLHHRAPAWTLRTAAHELSD